MTTGKAPTKQCYNRKLKSSYICRKILKITTITSMLVLTMTVSFASELKPIGDYSPQSTQSLIVFIPGFYNRPGWTETNGKPWPRVVADDPLFSDANVVTFNYGYFDSYNSDVDNTASTVKKHIKSFSEKLSRSLLSDEFNYHENVIFLADGLGGLIVKQLLLDQEDIFNKTLLIFLMDYPNTKDKLEGTARKLNAPNLAIRDMRVLDRNFYLESIERRWLRLISETSVITACKVSSDDAPKPKGCDTIAKLDRSPLQRDNPGPYKTHIYFKESYVYATRNQLRANSDSPSNRKNHEALLQAQSSVAGKDLDSDGVRDDIQQLISALNYGTPKERNAVIQSAKAMQQAILFGAGFSDKSLKEIGDQSAKAGDCIWDVFGLDGERELNILTLAMIDTEARSIAHNEFNKQSAGIHFSRNPPGKACE